MTRASPRSIAVKRWIRDNAHPLATLDPEAPLTDLEPLRNIAGDATVVGLGRSSRGAHELCAIAHRVLRFLVGELGFRVLALEEGWTKVMPLDEYVRPGEGLTRRRVPSGKSRRDHRGHPVDARLQRGA